MDETLDSCPIRRLEIIRQAESITHQFRAVAGERAYLGIQMQSVFDEIIYPKYEVKLVEHLDLGKDEGGNEILGQYDAGSNHLFFDSKLRNDPRRVFTFWHEIGHVVLHGEWLRRLMNLGGERLLILTTENSLSSRTVMQLEVQANLFASYAAAPTWLIEHAFKRMFGTQILIFNGPGHYSFCLPCGTQYREITDFDDMCIEVAWYLKRFFGGLSQQALAYRLKGSGFLVNRQSRSGLPRLNRIAKKAALQQTFAM